MFNSWMLSPAARAVDGVLDDLAGHYRRRARLEGQAPQGELLPRIDAAIGAVGGREGQEDSRRRAVIALVGLRRNLFPGAAPYARAAPAPGAAP